jgi:hypothetical protein
MKRLVVDGGQYSLDAVQILGQSGSLQRRQSFFPEQNPRVIRCSGPSRAMARGDTGVGASGGPAP